MPGHFLDRAVGSRHIPVDGACILVANHTSIGDILVFNSVLCAVRNESPQLLAKAEAFTSVLSVFYRALGGIPVDRANPGLGTVGAVERVLEEGRVLVIFPEGRRGPGDGRMLPFLNGPFALAVRTGVPVLPAAILGTDRILPKGRVIPHVHQARVAFGPALVPDITLPKRTRAAQLRHEARTAIGTMLTDLGGGTWDPSEAATEFGARADAVLRNALERPGTTARRAVRRQTMGLLRLGHMNDPDDRRLWGLKACLDLLPALTGPTALRGVRARLHPARVRLLQQAAAAEPRWRSLTAALDRLALLGPPVASGT